MPTGLVGCCRAENLFEVGEQRVQVSGFLHREFLVTEADSIEEVADGGQALCQTVVLEFGREVSGNVLHELTLRLRGPSFVV